MRTIEEKVASGQGVRDVSLPQLPRRFQFWRSPADQPRWARPALLAVAAVAVVAYAHGCGVGLELFWRERGRRSARVALAAALLSTVAYGDYLVHGGSDVPVRLLPLALLLAVIGAMTVRFALRADSDQRSAARATGVVVACALWLTVCASALVVTRGLGPFDTPFQPTLRGPRISPQRYGEAVQRFVAHLASTHKAPIALATDTSVLAARLIFYTGREILPVGGYGGGVPSPSLPQLQHDIAAGEVEVFNVAIKPANHDPRIVWIQRHCTLGASEGTYGAEVEFAFYDCKASSALVHPPMPSGLESHPFSPSSVKEQHER